MSNTSNIPTLKLDPSLYAWQPHPTTPRLYQRRALGLETKWVHRAAQNRQLFLSGTFNLESPLPSPIFQNAVVQAWLKLRFEFPEVSMKFSGDFAADGSAIMECQIPRSKEEAQEWVARTLFVGHAATDAQTAPGAEALIQTEAIDDPVGARLNSSLRPNSHSKLVIGGDFSFRVDHRLADGMGVYILAGNFFRILALEVSRDDKAKEMEWEQAAQNIPSPWVFIMNAKQEIEGENFEEMARQNTELVLESTKREWGLNVRAANGYKPMSIQKGFSIAQSRKILRAVKAKIGSNGSVTHLGHAAVVLTLLKLQAAKQTLPNKARFVSLLFMSGRRYLNPKGPKATFYVPMCRAIGAIEFRDVERYVCSEKDSIGEVQQKLKIACQEAKRSYQAIRERESVLTESFTAAEFISNAKTTVEDQGVVAPIFLSDGIVEQYLARCYSDEPGFAQILSIHDVRFRANPDGSPLIVRMSNFRDSIKLAAEWNAFHYAEEFVQIFLDSVAELMLGFAE